MIWLWRKLGAYLDRRERLPRVFIDTELHPDVGKEWLVY